MSYVPTRLQRELVIDAVVTIHYFEYMRDFVFPGESHDFWEFLYVDKGTVLVTAGERDYKLGTGEIIFHKPNEFHAIRSIGKKAPNLVAVSFLSSSLSMKRLESRIDTLSLTEREIISHLLALARQCFASPLHVPSVEQITLKKELPFGSPQLILMYLEMLLLSLMQERSPVLHRFAGSASTFSRYSKKSRLDHILSYMEAHICEQLSLDMICGAFSLSRSSLQALFHEKKGCGVMDFFQQMKIERAKEIIRDGTMNVTEVSSFLSYGSPQYFSRQFKKATGMSPVEYASSVKGITQTVKGIRVHGDG